MLRHKQRDERNPAAFPTDEDFYPKYMKIIDFPKLHSPFIRKTINDRYLLTPDVDPEYKWVFEDKGVQAVDKLDGTNVCLEIKDGNIIGVANRTTEKFLLSVKQTAWEGACMEGVAKAIQRSWLKDAEGLIYGELVGEMFQGNPHCVTGNLFVPFTYLQKKCQWHSWIANKYPKTYDSISEWFKELPSLFNERLELPPIKSEGLVFYHPDGRMAKLRRDMFDWYDGPQHTKQY